jgi:hypothetical protein
VVLCGTWSETFVGPSQLLSFDKFQDTKPLLIPCYHHVSSQLPLAVKPRTMSWRLLLKQTWRYSLPIRMLSSAASVLVAALPSSEFTEVLTNYPRSKWNSQSHVTVKHSHETRGAGNQEWLWWRGPAEIYAPRPVTVILTLQPAAIHFLARFPEYQLMKKGTADRLKYAQCLTWFLDNTGSEQDCILTWT